MDKTNFAGLTVLEPGEPLSTDNASFQSQNPLIIDHFLELGSRTHRHNGLAPMADPTVELGVATDTEGGAIPADIAVYLAYTLIDAGNGESLLSPASLAQTDPGLPRPESAPLGEVDYTAGTLLTDTYYYALTWTDGAGGETGLGPMIAVEREPGYANAQILLSALTEGMEDVPGVNGWRLYRATGGADFGLLASGTSVQDTFTDTGAASVDCTQLPPADTDNTTGSTNKLVVTLPDVAPEGAAALRLYASLDGSFTEGGILGTYALPAALGDALTFTSLEVVSGRPPVVATTVGGASKIDPDTELLDWHWKRPVAVPGDLPVDAEEGDVRISLDTGVIHRFVGGEWYAGESASITVNEEGNAAIVGINGLEFEATGLAGVTVTDLGAGVARITIDAAGGGGGGTSALDVSDDVTTLNDPTEIHFEGATVTLEGSTAVVTIAEPGLTVPLPNNAELPWNNTQDEYAGAIRIETVGDPEHAAGELTTVASEDFSVNTAPTGFTNLGAGAFSVTAGELHADANGSLAIRWDDGGQLADEDSIEVKVTFDAAFYRVAVCGAFNTYNYGLAAMVESSRLGANTEPMLTLTNDPYNGNRLDNAVPVGQPVDGETFILRLHRMGNDVNAELWSEDGATLIVGYGLTLTDVNAVQFGAGVNDKYGGIAATGITTALTFDEFKRGSVSEDVVPDSRVATAYVAVAAGAKFTEWRLVDSDGRSDLLGPNVVRGIALPTPAAGRGTGNYAVAKNGTGDLTVTFDQPFPAGEVPIVTANPEGATAASVRVAAVDEETVRLVATNDAGAAVDVAIAFTALPL